MKRLILFELIILFLATTFESDSPPGWFQQVLPRNNILVDDIYFRDSLNGWSTAHITPGFDTAFVFATTNGGSNWVIQYSYVGAIFNTIQFLNNNTGYAAGGDGFGRLFKTTNGGTNWNLFFSAGHLFNDLFFVNKDTGWVCDDDATFGVGVLKTTNGGVNWQSQLGASFKPTKLFFINKDTGWVNCNAVVNSGSYRTTNGGTNWNQMDNIGFIDMHFFNRFIGIRTSGEFYKTTNSGLNWFVSSSLTGGKLSFVSDSTGWAANDLNRITKTSTGGNTWFYQSSPIFNNLSISAVETLKAWAGGNGLVHTSDGGGPPVGIEPVGSEIPTDFKLYQNYPNPFNPATNIVYSIMSNVKGKMSKVVISLYDLTGREITKLVDKEQNAGTYRVDWNANNQPSGVYFYSLIIDGITIDTKKMILIK